MVTIMFNTSFNWGDILRVSTIGKKYSNLKRYKEIWKVLNKYGFGFLADKVFNVSLFNKLFFKESKILKRQFTTAERIRMAIEELGPTFIKLGQILSTRYDILPADIINELAKLQDDVSEFGLSVAEEIFREEVGLEMEEVFQTYDKTPLAAASIGQVYCGKLKNGNEVVIKVQRPNIEKTIETDIDILYTFAKLIDDHLNRQKVIKAADIANEFAYILRRELDYTYEAQNCEAFRKNFEGDKRVKIPKVYWEYTTKRVLVMERIKGIKVSNIQEIEKKRYGKEKLAEIGAKVFLEQIFIHKFFHADPHPGNIMVISQNQIGFIDFGVVGYLDDKTLDFIIQVLKSGIKKDIDKIIESLIMIDAITEVTDEASLKRDLFYVINYYFNLPVSKINFGDAFKEILSISYKHKVKMPSQLILLIKSIITIEGTGKKLNPRFKLTELSKDVFIDLTKRRFKSKDLVRNTFDLSKENFKDLLEIPKQVRQLLQKFEKNQIKFIMKQEGLKELERELNIMTNKISLSMIVAALIVGSSILIHSRIGPTFLGSSIIGLAGFTTAAILGTILLFSIIKSWINKK